MHEPRSKHGARHSLESLPAEAMGAVKGGLSILPVRSGWFYDADGNLIGSLETSYSHSDSMGRDSDTLGDD
jgi:hypothetical protein